MKSLSTYIEESHSKKHPPIENIIDDFRLVIMTTRISVDFGKGGSDSTGGKYHTTVERIREECKKKKIEFYIFYCEDGLIQKDDSGTWKIHNKGDEDGFDISSNDTVAIARGSIAEYNTRLNKIAQLEKLGIFCINSRDSTFVCSDKYMTHLRLTEAGIPTPKTMLLINDPKEIESITKKFDSKFPLIVKTLSGSKGVGVVFVESERALTSTVQLIWKINPDQELLIQEYIKTDYDVRCVVLGGNIQAVMKRNVVKGDFRSNYSLGGKTEQLKLTKEEKQVCIEAAKAVGGTWTAVDFIPNKKDVPFVLEVNSSPGTEGIEAQTKVNVVEGLLEYISNKNNWYSKTHECGLLETIEIADVGHMIAKFDTGSNSRSVIHADKYEIKNGKIIWELDGHKFKKDIIGYAKIVRGSIKAEVIRRPVIEFDIVFNGAKYKNIDFTVDDRSDKTTKLLMSARFIEKANLSINPARNWLLSIGHEDFDKYNKDHYNLVVKKGQSE